MRIAACLAVAAFLFLPPVFADGPADNIPTNVRRVPPLGIEVPDADRKELEAGLATLNAALDKLQDKAKTDARVRGLLPDIQIYTRAVHDALTYREFFAPPNARNPLVDVTKAKNLLKDGQARAEALFKGQAPWTTQTGLVVRGYVSKIDGSVQPYGLVIPPSYTDKTAGKYRLDLWFHGRGETLSEVNFLDEHTRSAGQFTPPDTIVLHPYGRYCNANKFAGEIDSLEAIDSVSARYRVDPDRISARGFSMGGAAAWQFAVHYTDLYFAANPGAGFSETPRFLDVFQKEKLEPTWYEKKLWNMYDCDKAVVNLKQLPTVAYSGEIDSQKQAADVMAEAAAKEKIALTHIIGPKTKHAYHPEAKKEVDRRLDALAVKGRNRSPREIDFVTYTLRYPKMFWLTVDGMQEHWSEARIRARRIDARDHAQLAISTNNISALTIDVPPGTADFRIEETPGVTIDIDGRKIVGPSVTSDQSWKAHLVKDGTNWSLVNAPPSGLVKTHGLQGPIDDAFMDSFIIVRPTGKSKNDKFAAWSKAEMDRAIEHWRRHFRGDARVKDDTAITDADIASSNLIVWGDADSNAIIKKALPKLPLQWGDTIKISDQSFPSGNHAPILIQPNPLNPKRYIVLNSGFTFREYDYLNNARQVPKLPDWAIVNLDTPPNPRFPGKVVAADFFDEHWAAKPTLTTK